MGFRTGAYATIWKVEPQQNITKVQMSVSKKNKQTGNYETDFSGFVSFIGSARNDILKYNAKDKIKIGDCDVTTFYQKEKNTTYTNYAIFSFEDASYNNNEPQKPSAKDGVEDGFVDLNDNDEVVPF